MRVDLSASVHSKTGALIDIFFNYLELLDPKAYHRRMSNGGANTLILYPHQFTGEEMDIVLNMFTEGLKYKELGELFKRYISLGIHHLKRPKEIQEQIDNYEIN